MIKVVLFVFFTLLLATVFVPGQAARKRPASRPAPGAGTVSGTLYWGGDGQGMQYCLLKTTSGIVEIVVTKRTKVTGFPDDGSAWNLGSEWKVTYHRSKHLDGSFEADSVTFLGSNSAIVGAAAAAREYLDALSSETINYKKAYSILHSSVRNKLSIADLEELYMEVDFERGSIRVCSHSDQKVSLLFAFDGEFAHRAELMRTASGDQDAGKYQISRLLPFGDTLRKEEALCQASRQ